MKNILSLIVIILLTLSGCSTSQKVTGFWADPSASELAPYKQVFIIVLSPKKDANYSLETEIGNTLVSRGYKVMRFSDMFPPGLTLSKNYTREQFTESIKKTGCDAVFTLALLDSKEVETYHPGSNYYPMNYGYYGSFYGYYNYYSPQVYSEGYYSVDKTFYLETNLYDLAADKLIWSVQSQARNPESLEKGFKKYSSMLIDLLKSKSVAKK